MRSGAVNATKTALTVRLVGRDVQLECPRCVRTWNLPFRSDSPRARLTLRPVSRYPPRGEAAHEQGNRFNRPEEEMRSEAGCHQGEEENPSPEKEAAGA